ncbi:MAG: CHAT domain-containing protein [Chloroflexi bacterium]|uniref:CHAT domain-containing protein n=1 Tax=Candidatus Chlorohelix allophototropha TaxID=3003348 RepID=A0A8T7M5M4_9CHLR|nr:CHAT domain-containing protein [Chloroflexota bacterium]WJW69329.1 CHAT domain-containing protein [Chloroflexota bacterium L227-S17]
MDSAESFVSAVLAAQDDFNLCYVLEQTAPTLNDTLAQQVKSRANELVSSDNQASLKIAESLIKAGVVANNLLYQALGLMVQGNVMMRRGELQRAIELYDDAKVAALRANNPIEAARSQVGKIGALMYLGDYKSAIEIAQHTAETLVAFGDYFPAAKAYANAAICYGELEQNEKAVEELQKARTLFEKHDSREAQTGLGLLLYNLSVTLCDLGRYHEALDCSLRASEIARRYELSNDEALYQEASAICYSLMGNYNRALRLHLEARDIFEKNGLIPQLIACEYFISEGYLELGRYEDAADQAKELISLLEQRNLVNSWNGTRTYHVLGRALAGLEQPSEAAAALLMAQSIAEQLGASGFKQRTDLRLAETYLSTDNPEDLDRSEELLNALLSNPQDLRILPNAQLLLARLETNREQYSAAIELAKSALTQFESQGIYNTLYSVYWQLAKICEQQGELNQASDYLDLSIQQLEQLRAQVAAETRHSFLLQKETIYQDAVRIALRFNDSQKAFDLVERVKSRALVELVGNQLDIKIKIRSERDRPLVEELENLRARHNDLTMRLARWQDGQDDKGELVPVASNENQNESELLQSEVLVCEKRLIELTEILQVKNALYAEDVSLIQSYISFDFGLLNPNEAIIEYYQAREEMLAFVVTRAGIKAITLSATPSQVNRLVSLLHQNFNQTPKLGAEKLLLNSQNFLSKLYALVFEPLELELAPITELRIVSHGTLHYLPFHALYRPSDSTYLLERFSEISYVPAAKLLLSCRERAKNSTASGALVLGYSGNGKLTSTLEEAEEINCILSRKIDTELALENDANLELFRQAASSKRLLHLATHGSFRENAPLFSSIQLEGGELTAHELYNLQLEASLMTLSCCESGLGVIGGGDEVMGLSRSCLYAGASSLALSLWRVEDKSSSQLMQLFYRNLLDGMGKAAALRQAQLWLMSEPQYRHPFYWAPFILIGDSGSL